jgi:membrane dipeptidase
MPRFPADALVLDMVLPIHEELGNSFALIDRYAEAGFSFVSFTIAGDDYDISGTMKRLARVRAEIAAAGDRAVFAFRGDDIRSAKASGKIAVGLHLEGTECHERDPGLVEIYHALGIRHNLIAFNRNNAAGGGCADLGDGGLTRLGREIVAEMNRVGMLVDLAHTGERTVFDIIERSSDPVMNSHTATRALHPHYRNVSDAQIDAIAATGGVMGISGFSAYLGDPACRVETVFRHIDHIVQRVGPAHVGFGFDFIGSTTMLADYIAMRGPDEWPVINDIGYDPINVFPPFGAAALVPMMAAAGYDNAAITGILGGNWMRLIDKVWR